MLELHRGTLWVFKSIRRLVLFGPNWCFGLHFFLLFLLSNYPFLRCFGTSHAVPWPLVDSKVGVPNRKKACLDWANYVSRSSGDVALIMHSCIPEQFGPDWNSILCFCHTSQSEIIKMLLNCLSSSLEPCRWPDYTWGCSRIDALIFHSSVPRQLEKRSEFSSSFISLSRGSLEFHGITRAAWWHLVDGMVGVI